jgi:hypothetical protein
VYNPADIFIKTHWSDFVPFSTARARPLQNAPFCPIPALAPWNAKLIPLGSGSNFNPQNTQCFPACPVGPSDRTGVVKIFAFLDIEQN